MYLYWFAAKNCSVRVVRAQLIMLNSSSIHPLVDLAWASGEHFENKPTCINIL